MNLLVLELGPLERAQVLLQLNKTFENQAHTQ